IPIIATGHLFAAGGTTTEDDGVRELYVGSLGKISADMFDEGFDYVALGHLHVPQRVGGRESIRYSGSPIAMGFGEAKQQKQVLLVQFGAVERSLSESTIIQLTNTVTTIEKAAKKVASRSTGFIDDLFGFDDSVESDVKEESTVEEGLAQTDDAQNTDLNSTDINSKETSALAAKLTSQLLHHDESRQMQVVSLPIPKFQKLAQISGDLA